MEFFKKVSRECENNKYCSMCKYKNKTSVNSCLFKGNPDNWDIKKIQLLLENEL